jgi:hypothetical protein
VGWAMRARKGEGFAVEWAVYGGPVVLDA